MVGYNYRMTNVAAAIGVAQMETIDRSISERQQIADWYAETLAPLKDKIMLPTTEPWAKPVCWMYTVYLKTGTKLERDAVMKHMAANDIETRPVFHPMHVMPPYKDNKSYPVADTWACRGINLPTWQGLVKDDILRIAQSLRNALDKI